MPPFFSLSNFFSYRGRVNRSRYFWNLLVLDMILPLIFSVVPSWLLFFLAFSTDIGDIAATLYAIVLYVGFPVCVLVAAPPQVVRRCHDLGHSGHNGWKLLIPLFNILVALDLLFRAGESGENKYGPPPRLSQDDSDLRAGSSPFEQWLRRLWMLIAGFGQLAAESKPKPSTPSTPSAPEAAEKKPNVKERGSPPPTPEGFHAKWDDESEQWVLYPDS